METINIHEMETINIHELSKYFAAYQNIKRINPGYNGQWVELIEDELKKLPHGSGIDSGVKFDWDRSTPEKLYFLLSFHHEYDSYDRWTDHEIIITPSLQFGYRIKITGINRNDIKEYLYDTFYSIFTLKTNK